MPDPELQLSYKRIGRDGKIALAAKAGDETAAVDELRILRPAERERFADQLTTRLPGVDRAGVLAELEGIAAELVDGEGAARRTQADALVGLAADAELFHGPGGADAEAFASFEVGGHRETWPIASRGFRRWLAQRHHAEHGKAPNSQSLADALDVLAGQALFDGAELPVAVRIGAHGGACYLDLADADWQAVEITPGGWRVLTSNTCPVRFWRPKGLLPLPVPVAGGDVAELRPLVNVPDDDSWALLLCWLAAALRPVGPYPVLILNGEAGSAKSTTARLLRALVDPNAAPLRAEPREGRDLMIAARNGWALAFDNLSSVPPWLSDALCRLATGGGFATRQLYTDSEEMLFDSMRPVVLNGIDDLASRGDLADRAIVLTLPAIPDDRRLPERELWATFEAARPRILGALLDAVSAGLRNLPGVRLPSLPRLADFAEWATACEPALGLARGAFMAAYADNRAAAVAAALESAAIGPPLLGLVADRGSWEGTARELLAELNTDRRSSERDRRRRDWPATPRKLAGDVRRLAPELRRVEIEATFHRLGNRRTRIIRLEKVGITSSASSAPSADAAGAPENADLCGRYTADADGITPDPSADRPRETGPGASENTLADHADDADGIAPVFSGERAPDGEWGEL